ncbi:MAG: PEP-CTERM system TPR-repeat protein PrsT [Hydrogenophaga sp.]|nr:PEP-CTERM system TPR-repeat protein PrsT [Hydrogenophaga sp.]
MKPVPLRVSLPWRAAPITLAVALLLGACADRDPQKMVESARAYLEQDDHPAAIIQLKNALQENPELAEARMLLGKALWLNGDPVGAETELLKARDLGHRSDELSILLVRTRVAQGRFRQVTDEFDQVELVTPEANADLKTLMAIAWRQQGRQDAFESRLQAALAAKPDHGPALVEQARFKASQQDFDGALAVLNGVLTGTGSSAESLKLKGDILLYGHGDRAGALEAYRAATAASPRYTDAQAGLVRVLLSQDQVEPAAAELDRLKKMAPEHPQTLYLRAQLAFQQRDYAEAREAAQALLKLTPDSPMALELAAATEYQFKAWSQAEPLAVRALQSSPQLRVARRVLVMTYLRSGQMDKALAALPPDIATSQDANMLAVAGQVHMVRGDTALAQQLFSRAAQLDPADPSKRTSLAVTQLMAGESDVALDSLRDIAATDSGVLADMALINAHLQKKELDQALVAIADLEKKRASDPMPAQLRGRVLLMRNDRSGARAAFERALSLDADYFAATSALAGLDVAEGKPEAARQRLEAVAQRNPRHTQALLVLADLNASTGASKDVVAGQIRQAIDADRTDKAAHVRLVDHYLRHNDARSALQAAQTAVAALPQSPEALDALGRAQTANGDIHQALSSFNKLVGLMPRSPLPFLRQANTHIANQNTAAASQSLRKALELQPDLLLAQRGLVDLALQGKRPADALAVARTVQQQRPREPIGFAMEGDIQAAGRNWDGAGAAYRQGLKLAPAPDLAIKLHTVLLAQGKSAEAERVAADWLKAQPGDAAFLLYLGDRAIASNQLADAQRHYERVVQAHPRNALALNNLAWVAGRLGRDDAVALAERANELAPNQPAYMDTLAVLLSERNEVARALALQKKVVELEPNAALFKLSLARIHLKAGDKAAAEPLLAELAALGDRFGGQAEVRKLREGL